MDLRNRIQPEMDQGPDGERRLVAHRHALHRFNARRAVPYQYLSSVSRSSNSDASTARCPSGSEWWAGFGPGSHSFRSEPEPCGCNLRRARLRSDLYLGFDNLWPRRFRTTDHHSQWHLAVPRRTAACPGYQALRYRWHVSAYVI